MSCREQCVVTDNGDDDDDDVIHIIRIWFDSLKLSSGTGCLNSNEVISMIRLAFLCFMKFIQHAEYNNTAEK